MSRLFKVIKRCSSNLALSDCEVFTEKYYHYNKTRKYYKEETKYCYIKNNNTPIYANATGNICQVCKGNGIIFNINSVIDFNYYKLCDNCRGTGLV